MARIRIQTTPTDSTPAANQLSIYARPDNNLYTKDSSGVERKLLDDTMSGVGAYEVEYFILTPGDIAAKELTLSATPVNAQKVLVNVDGAPPCFYNLDYTVSGNKVQWTGSRFDGLLETGDVLQIVYVV